MAKLMNFSEDASCKAEFGANHVHWVVQVYAMFLPNQVEVLCKNFLGIAYCLVRALGRRAVEIGKHSGEYSTVWTGVTLAQLKIGAEVVTLRFSSR